MIVRPRVLPLAGGRRQLGNRTGRDRSSMFRPKSARIHGHFADLTDPMRRAVTYP
jgi:hypothetical protein